MPEDYMTTTGSRTVEALVTKLRRRQVVGARQTAVETLIVLRQAITKARFSNIDQLLDLIRGVGRRLVEAQPKEHTVGNVVRRVLHNVREDYVSFSKEASVSAAHPAAPTAYSIAKFVLAGQPRRQPVPRKVEVEKEDKDEQFDPSDPDSFIAKMKPACMEVIQNFLHEIESIYEDISTGAENHVHPDEIILTIGMSQTVATFLQAAHKKRNFTVIVSESGPSYSGHEMAKILSNAGIDSVLVPDSSIYALMSRVNKVIIGAHAILANGGMFAIAGALLVATAARAHSTPVAVCAAQFKMTPLWNLYHDHGALDFADPSAVLGFEEGNLVDKVDVVNPYYDYVAPDLVDVYITENGDHPPSSVYRLVKEAYDDEDL